MTLPPRCIGIAGGTGAGKTTLAHALAQRYADSVAVIPLDAYYRDLGHLPETQRAAWNFDHPDAMEWELLLEHVDALARGVPIAIPVYDFHRHRRTKECKPVPPRPVLILEGLHALHHPQLRSRMVLKVFLDIPEATRLERRIVRDTAERGRSPGEVTAQFHSTVAPMYARYIAPARAHADLILAGDELEHLLARLAGEIERILGVPQHPLAMSNAPKPESA